MTAAALQVTREIAADHPAFAGHFPHQPVLPGAVLLAEVIEALRSAPDLHALLGPCPNIAVAKFLAPVRPGSRLTIRLSPSLTGSERALAFEVHTDTARAASGRLVFVLPELRG